MQKLRHSHYHQHFGALVKDLFMQCEALKSTVTPTGHHLLFARLINTEGFLMVGEQRRSALNVCKKKDFSCGHVLPQRAQPAGAGCAVYGPSVVARLFPTRAALHVFGYLERLCK